MFLDYMVKPITFDRFYKGVTKARDYFAMGKRDNDITISKSKSDYFFVKCDAIFEKIYHDEVEYVQALQNYVVIYTEGRKYMTLLPMKRMEELLGNDRYIRVHKSYLVALNKNRCR